MSRKIFVSYKYSDRGVQALGRVSAFGVTTARHYVDELQEHLAAEDHIYKGEDDGEDLSDFKEDTIETKLKDKLFDSSTTIILVSKNMKDSTLPESDQWIPWEISYSMKEITRNDRTSLTNTMIAVVLPDENGSYTYFIEPLGCPHCSSILWKNETLFSILGKNMFNRKRPNVTDCTYGRHGTLHIGRDHSFIYPVKWSDFISNIDGHLDIASQIRENIEHYDLVKVVD